MAGVAAAVIAGSALLLTVTTLLNGEDMFLKGVKKQIEQLKTDLQWMVLKVEEAFDSKSDKGSHLFSVQLHDLIFDAEEVIEEFMVNIGNHKRLTVRLIPFRHGLGNRIIDINTKVQKLMENHKSTAGCSSSSSLQQQIKDRRAEIFNEIRLRQEPFQMYDSSAKHIIDLLKGESDDGMQLCIISIIGMGGVGKTTLSWKYYNDENVKKEFIYRAFVYVSEAYSLPDLFKSIMESCCSVNSDGKVTSKKAKAHLRNRSVGEVTSEMVKAHLQNHKYLIVLDDIWDTDAWDKLKGAFPDANNGSRVLLTTRHKHVALMADEFSNNTNNIYELSAINDETASWNLFLDNYLPFRRSSVNYPTYFSSDINLELLGKQLVEKCHGLPLAIVVLGGVLSIQMKAGRSFGRSEYTVWSSEYLRLGWLLSRINDSYRKCPGILALSYDYLPYRLKPCFLYMSLFPGTDMIHVTKLFQYWIAEGYVIKEGEEMLEDAAKAYLEDLISRSLIQVGETRCDGSVKTCHIHGLLHRISTTESTADDFSKTYGSVDEFNEKKTRSRRVIICKDQKNQQKKCEQHLLAVNNTRIRSLVCYEDVHFSKKINSFFGGFKSLRVLEFYGYTGIVTLPKELGELVHLRYLSLEKTKLQEINTCYLSKLVNLQTLNLRGDHIGDKELVLDDQIWCFKQLRHLYLRNIRPAANNKRQKSPDEELQVLVIQAGDWIEKVGLENMSSLRRLKLEECLFSHSSNISSAIAKLTKLRSFSLICKTFIDEPEIKEQVYLDSIQFSKHYLLVRLHLQAHILNWPGDHNSFPPHLYKLKLKWSRIKVDPMKVLEKLPHLKFLHLGFESYEGEEMICSKGGFASLQTLELVSILSLRRWIIMEGALASLTKLEICDCKNLRIIPNGLKQLTTLKELRVTNMPPQFRNRVIQGGKDWHKIQHIPNRDRLA